MWLICLEVRLLIEGGSYLRAALNNDFTVVECKNLALKNLASNVNESKMIIQCSKS